MAKREKEIEATIKALKPGHGVDWGYIEEYMKQAMNVATNQRVEGDSK